MAAAPQKEPSRSWVVFWSGRPAFAILCFAVTDSTEFRKIDSTSFGRHAVTQVIKPKLILGARSAQEISGTSFMTPTTTKCLLRESADGILIIANLSRAASADQAIYGEWSGATRHESREAGEVEKTHFVAWRSKLRSCRGYGHELDRAKTVRQVHRQQGYQQDSRHGEAGNRHKRARKDSKAPAQFNEYRCPCHAMRRWNTQGL